MIRRALVVMILALPAATPPVAAEEGCWYSGQLYPPGTRIGGMKCENGEWVAA